MALTAVTPLEPQPAEDCSPAAVQLEDANAELRVHLTRPPDKENELIKVAAVHGPAGILAVLRAKESAYSWIVALCLRALEVCLGPRGTATDLAVLDSVDPVAFALQMLELEMIDEIFQLMKYYAHVRDIQHHGLAIVEILVMDDAEWRDEVARKGGVALICDIAKQRKDNAPLMCQVMATMSYLAAEDYIEVMLCQHDALVPVVYVLQKYVSNVELVTRASLALLNLTVCEPHVEELMDKQALLPVLTVLDQHTDLTLVTIVMGVLANFSVKDEARHLLAREGALRRIRDVMATDPGNSVLQVACLKALVNYSTNVEHYAQMEQLGIPDLVTQAVVTHARDAGVQRYGNYFFGRHTHCPIL